MNIQTLLRLSSEVFEAQQAQKIPEVAGLTSRKRHLLKMATVRRRLIWCKTIGHCEQAIEECNVTLNRIQAEESKR